MGLPLTHVGYEITFRFNRRRSNTHEMLFYRLAQQAIAATPAPYSSIIYGKSPLRASRGYPICGIWFALRADSARLLEDTVFFERCHNI